MTISLRASKTTRFLLNQGVKETPYLHIEFTRGEGKYDNDAKEWERKLFHTNRKQVALKGSILLFPQGSRSPYRTPLG